MNFHIDQRIFQTFPGLHIGLIVAKNIDNTQPASPDIAAATRTEEARIRQNFQTETLSQDPHIDVWRKAFSAFGVKPKDGRASIESLYRLIINGRDLRSFNAIVDVYNLISIKHMLPLGGEDIDNMSGDVVLTFAGANETPITVLGDTEPQPPREGEVIYKDGIATICRCWNWREVDRTKLTEQTKNCILVVEGLPPITKEHVVAALAELKTLVQKNCGGQNTTLDEYILDIHNPEAPIT